MKIAVFNANDIELFGKAFAEMPISGHNYGRSFAAFSSRAQGTDVTMHKALEQFHGAVTG